MSSAMSSDEIKSATAHEVNNNMSKLSVDIFAQKIEYICDKLGYKKRTRQENKDHLSTLVKVTPR